MIVNIQNDAIYEGKFVVKSITQVENPEKYEHYKVVLQGFERIVRFDPTKEDIRIWNRLEGGYYEFNFNYMEGLRNVILKAIKEIKCEATNP